MCVIIQLCFFLYYISGTKQERNQEYQIFFDRYSKFGNNKYINEFYEYLESQRYTYNGTFTDLLWKYVCENIYNFIFCINQTTTELSIKTLSYEQVLDQINLLVDNIKNIIETFQNNIREIGDNICDRFEIKCKQKFLLTNYIFNTIQSYQQLLVSLFTNTIFEIKKYVYLNVKNNKTWYIDVVILHLHNISTVCEFILRDLQIKLSQIKTVQSNKFKFLLQKILYNTKIYDFIEINTNVYTTKLKENKKMINNSTCYKAGLKLKRLDKKIKVEHVLLINQQIYSCYPLNYITLLKNISNKLKELKNNTKDFEILKNIDSCFFELKKFDEISFIQSVYLKVMQNTANQIEEDILTTKKQFTSLIFAILSIKELLLQRYRIIKTLLISNDYQTTIHLDELFTNVNILIDYLRNANIVKRLFRQKL